MNDHDSFQKIKEQFISDLDLYENLGKSLVDTISVLLKKSELDILSVSYRVKEINSFLGKMERKSYKDPLTEIEDICGIRIICYYKKDISFIKQILEREFVIFESTDKESILNVDQFGYRSHHLIITIKKEWEEVPIFRGLSGKRAEIQIRTLLMHAWAEIEHTLAYKNEAQTPSQFRRKIHRISAKLEEADEQFEDLKIENEKYQGTLTNVVNVINETVELNLYTLQAYIDSNFPQRSKNIERIGEVLNEMNYYGITLKDLDSAWVRVKPKIKALEREYWKNKPVFNKWTQTGMLRAVLSLGCDKYFNNLSANRRSDFILYRKRFFPSN